MRTWLGVCSRCGLCAEGCLFYLEQDRDPRMSPAYEVRKTLGEMYRRKGRVDREFLEQCKEILWVNAGPVSAAPFTVRLESMLLR